jgi:hypothetical protein
VECAQTGVVSLKVGTLRSFRRRAISLLPMPLAAVRKMGCTVFAFCSSMRIGSPFFPSSQAGMAPVMAIPGSERCFFRAQAFPSRSDFAALSEVARSISTPTCRRSTKEDRPRFDVVDS